MFYSSKKHSSISRHIRYDAELPKYDTIDKKNKEVLVKGEGEDFGVIIICSSDNDLIIFYTHMWKEWHNGY